MDSLDWQSIPMDPLTERQIQVLTLIAEGKTVEEIAAALFLSAHTIRTHVRNIRVSLHARSTPHAVAKAIRAGLLQ